MRIYKKDIGSDVMRIPKEVKEILTGEVTMILAGDTVIMVKGRYVRKETIDTLQMIIDLVTLAGKLEKEETNTEMKEVLSGD